MRRIGFRKSFVIETYLVGSLVVCVVFCFFHTVTCRSPSSPSSIGQGTDAIGDYLQLAINDAEAASAATAVYVNKEAATVRNALISSSVELLLNQAQ